MRTAFLIALLPLAALPLAGQTPQPAPAPPPAAAAPAASGYGAWFGSRPSMDGRDDGVLVDGVTEGSPADKAGVKPGDLIVKMGRTDVRSLMTMTEVLRSHRPGDTLVVVVKRGVEQKSVRVVLGVRP